MLLYIFTGLKYKERNQTMWHHNSHKWGPSRASSPTIWVGCASWPPGVRSNIRTTALTYPRWLNGVHLLKSCVSVHLFVCAVFNPEDRDATLLPHPSSVAEARRKVSPAGLWTMTGGKHLLLLLLLLAGQAKALWLSISVFLHWGTFGERFESLDPF